MNQSRLITSVGASLVGFMLPGLAALPALATPPGVGVAVGTTFDLFTASEVIAWNTVRPKDSAEITRELRQEPLPSCHSIPDSTALAEENPQIKILAPALGAAHSAA
jgi:mRNA degradation ribonuclease J1/J2